MKAEGVQKAWDKYKFVVLVVLAGVVLLLWPSGKTQAPAAGSGTKEARPIQTDTVQQEMEEILSKISGAGQLRLMLTVEPL